MGARFNFGKKEEVGYNPYGKVFTQRQKEIIWGFPVHKLRLQEITTIIRKAEMLDMGLVCEMLYERYEELITGKTPPKYTLEEAKSILQSLTPWER